MTDGPQLQGIALLNIPSTHGGTNMWGDSRLKSSKSLRKPRRHPAPDRTGPDLSGANQDIGDKLIEVVGLENCLHMGQVWDLLEHQRSGYVWSYQHYLRSLLNITERERERESKC